MKIAYVVPYVPNLIRVRSYKLIEHLSKLGVDITLFTAGTGSEDLRDVDRLRLICGKVYFRNQPLSRSLLNCLVALPSDRPLQSVYSWNPRLAREIKNAIDSNTGRQGFDLVHVEHLRGSRYAEFVRNRLPAMPLVWDSVDCISQLFHQAANQSRGAFGKVASMLDLQRTRKAEGRQVCQVDHVLVTSSADRNALLNLVLAGSDTAPISVLSNGVDLVYYHAREGIQKEPETIVFSGKMSYHANITMATYLVHEIMPRVWGEKPNTKVIIVGKDPTSEVRKFTENPLVTVTGTVDDIRPYLWRASIAVVPLVYGAGIQNKILEAMASSTPVVATSRTLSALQAEAGKDLLIADHPEDFAMQILRLMNDSNLYGNLLRNGLAYVQKFHDWENIAKQLMDIYRQTVKHKNNLPN